MNKKTKIGWDRILSLRLLCSKRGALFFSNKKSVGTGFFPCDPLCSKRGVLFFSNKKSVGTGFFPCDPFVPSEVRYFLAIKNRDDRIRTCDPLVPSEVRYQAALHPDYKPLWPNRFNYSII